MKLLCPLAQGDEFGTIQCIAGDTLLPCSHQRYCALDSEWQNSNDVAHCERRIKVMAEVKTNAAPVKEEAKPTNKKKGKVILITVDGCIAEIDGENVSFYGRKYRTYKVGEIYEF